MSQDRVACYCNSCNEQVCLSINEWTPINDRYFTYEDPSSYKQTCLDLDFEIDEFEQLQGWTFRVLRCGHCGLNLGGKSLVAPKEKEKYQYVGKFRFVLCLPSNTLLVCELNKFIFNEKHRDLYKLLVQK